MAVGLWACATRALVCIKRNSSSLLLLLLLRAPAISLGFAMLGEIFVHVTIFNPTTEAVIFILHGWCMLGVFWLPAFTHPEYECQDLLSPCDGMHVCTD